jgi:rSAM/selenodomain-associated transferase 2
LVSVIIPTYRECSRLPLCLAALLPPAQRLGIEVLVVDGGSDDGTREWAASRAGIRLLEARRGRASQMNAGARAARGSLFLFLPADTLLPDTALPRLAVIDRRGTPPAGGFRQRFDGERRFLRMVSLLHNARARLTGVFYGDQAPFVRRELFFALGGYREEIDMEDVDFGSRLRRHARTTMLDLGVVTSSRRFDAAGDLRATATAAGLLLGRAVLRRVPRSRTFFSTIR